MILSFPKINTSQYSSNSQRIRVLSENWLLKNVFCPYCENKLTKLSNNNPLGDFLCEKCHEEYELKSKEGANTNQSKIADGEYYTKIRRLRSNNNPNLLFLTYKNRLIHNLILIPRYYFTENIIEKRPPLLPTARRAGWTGSNIILSLVPNEGRIFIINNMKEISPHVINKNILTTSFIKEQNLETRSWIIDVMKCVNKIKTAKFNLNDIYKFEKQLKLLHPNNNHITDKIRQQLQLLRDKGILDFLGNGIYKKKY